MLFDGSASPNPTLQYPAAFYQDNQVFTLSQVVGGVEERRHQRTASSTSTSRNTASSTSRDMPPKRERQSGSPSTGTPAKLLKTEQKPEDFSNSVKKRLQSSTRTGQACDRCKVCAPLQFLSSRHEGNQSLDPIDIASGSKNSMRRSSRRMLAMHREPDTMPDDGSYHWPRCTERIFRRT